MPSIIHGASWLLYKQPITLAQYLDWIHQIPICVCVCVCVCVEYWLCVQFYMLN